MASLKKKYRNGQPRKPAGTPNPRNSSTKRYERDTAIVGYGRLPYATKKS